MNEGHTVLTNVYTISFTQIAQAATQKKPPKNWQEIFNRVRHSDFIVGVDDSRSFNNEILLFGLPFVKEIANGRGAEWPSAQETRIHFQGDVDQQLEQLCGFIQFLKGRCEHAN